MAHFFTAMIHHKGNWFIGESALGLGLLTRQQDNSARDDVAVEQYLFDSCHAKKMDLAFVDTLTQDNDTYDLYLADISAFSDEIPSFLQKLTHDNVNALSHADAFFRERVMRFIAECRKATAALLGKEVNIIMDRPVGTRHPKHPEIIYPINYGYIDGMFSADGEGIDVYLLGIHEPLSSYRAKIIAIVRREDDIEDKLAAAPLGMDFTEEEIAREIHFQEQFYRSSVHKSI